MVLHQEPIGIERITNARRREQAELVFEHIIFRGGKVIFDAAAFGTLERRTGLAQSAIVQALDDLDDAGLVRVKKIGEQLFAQLCIGPEYPAHDGVDISPPPPQPRRVRFVTALTRQGGR